MNPEKESTCFFRKVLLQYTCFSNKMKQKRTAKLNADNVRLRIRRRLAIKRIEASLKRLQK